MKQLVRSSGSIAANYLEAQEALSKKDFVHRVRIARKEARESLHWLELLDLPSSQEEQRNLLMREASELVKILTTIVKKCEIASS